jgi:hypothetical protein
MIRRILILVAFDAVWTCREIKTFHRNTLSPSSMYFGSERRDIIFLPIDVIDLQAHSVNTQNNNTVVFTARELPVSLRIIITFLEIQILFEVWRFTTMSRHIVLKFSFCFNLINYLVVIKITFPNLVLFTCSGEIRAQTYSFWPPDWRTVKPGPGGPTNIYGLSKTLTMFEVKEKLTELLSR